MVTKYIIQVKMENLYNERISGHKIEQVIFRSFRARYPRLHGKNAKLGYHGFGGTVRIVQLITDKGATGWGALCTSHEEAVSKRDELIGKAVTEVFEVETGILDERWKAFDIALHDLVGVILEIPVSKMISEDATDKVKVYDGAIYMNDLIPEMKSSGIDTVIKDCEYDYKLGHRTFKIKIGRSFKWMEHDEGLHRDIEVVKRVHEHFPDALIMVDANDGYTVEDCISFLEGIGDCEIYWFEEPFREKEEDNARLKEYLKKNRPLTLIADGESYTDIPLMYDLAEKGLLDIWQPDVCGYGFTAWRKLLKDITKKGYMSSPHAWGEVIKTHYCAHLAAAYPHHIPYIESVLGDSEGVNYEEYTLKEGIMTIPNKPGFGMELIWAREL